MEQYDMVEAMAKYDLVQNFNLLSVSDVRAKVSVGIISFDEYCIVFIFELVLF